MAATNQICTYCTKNGFNKSIGMVCTLTQEKPNVINTCPDYELDVQLKKREDLREAELGEKKLMKETGGLAEYGINNPVIAGILLTAFFGLALFFQLLMHFIVIYVFVACFIGFLGGLVVLINGIVKKRKAKQMKNTFNDTLDIDLNP
ncbi:MAG: hypothetical protein K1X56_12465 [Flavobacteriales bacterium]|nr:hypothetical protein [Flavobacteriales bacterium]